VASNDARDPCGRRRQREATSLADPREDATIVTVGRTREDQLLPGEWACLGILYPAPAHGFAIATRLKPDGDVGRVWSLSRALTYRSLDQLELRGHVRAVGEEPGIAGGNRTILAATRAGRAQLRKWLSTPVPHPRDLRSELLLKLVIAELCSIDVTEMLILQRQLIVDMRAALEVQVALDRADVVSLWRSESTDAALRFLDRLTEARHPGPSRVRSARR
jgi:PadR family transcriptional regulator AphA